MHSFAYLRVTSPEQAIAAAAAGGRLIAGGTTLIDLMRQGVETPAALVDVNRLDELARVTASADRLTIGATARMADVGAHPEVARRWPVIAQALELSASAQLRNMASIGGNLMQRTRCTYFRDPTVTACNKRVPGSGCSALDGENRMHAILGGSGSCVATHPSDLAVALAALEASVKVRGPQGEREIAFGDFHLLPGETPHIEHALQAGELILSVDVMASPAAERSVYTKLRDRESYEFALTSIAAGLDMADGDVRHVCIALGGVATKPWRATGAEAALRGLRLTRDGVMAAADRAVDDARPLAHNGFKVELAKRVIAQTLMELGGLA